jgi:hypothetical protein
LVEPEIPVVIGAIKILLYSLETLVHIITECLEHIMRVVVVAGFSLVGMHVQRIRLFISRLWSRLLAGSAQEKSGRHSRLTTLQ